MAINVNFSGAMIRVPGYYGGSPWMFHKSKQHWQLFKLLNNLHIAELDHEDPKWGNYTTWHDVRFRRP